MLSRPIPQPKSRDTRKRVRGRKQRAETKVKKVVRAACVERDSDSLGAACRIFVTRYIGLIVDCVDPCIRGCDGDVEWAHLRGHRRSQTRGQAATVRHTTKHSLMLCQRHHGMEERGELKVEYLSDRGCDGPLRFTV